MKNTSYLLATVAAALFISGSANAAGFYIQEQSSSAGGAAYSGAASNTKDASTLFYNPAGITKLGRAQANIGVQVLIPDEQLSNTGSTSGGSDGGNPFNPTPVPSGFAATPVSAVDGLWLGLGVTNPFGLALKYDSDWFGRFDSVTSKLMVTDIQPTAAYQVNQWLSLAAGVDAQRASAYLTNAADAGAPGEGVSRLKGQDWGVGYTLGAQIELDPATTLGLSYRSKVHHDLEGAVRVNGIPASASVTQFGAHASLVTPDIASVGLSHKLDSQWTVMGQANWYGWDTFHDISVIRDDNGNLANSVLEEYKNVWGYALGAEYAYSPSWTFRGGMQYDNTPTQDATRTTRTPDGDRTWFSAGATYNLTDNMSIDMNASYLHVEDERINVTRANVPVQTVSATTDGQIGIVGAAFNYKF